MKRRYSGKKSQKFWNKVNSIKGEDAWNKVHKLGCQLRDLENKVLNELAKAKQER